MMKMLKMLKMLKLLWRALIFIARDVFVGFLVALSAALVMFRLNPDMNRVIAILIPAGIIAGFFKGVVKFTLLNITSSLPSKGYRFNYPKFKLLGFWLAALLGALLFAYGTNLSLWFSGPMDLLRDNIVLGLSDEQPLELMAVLIFILGISAHIYEPPYNEDETLPPEEDETSEEDETELE
ncbi:hypothetical protein [Phosphitispora fastidiosa]|uniref:hypothetical protein n=1 Tax=Phosphitispora fastidiosa TaxID=2837202 RepID=UPI001E458873|nr:hypothetical protein [Phosphitispora fastidiosa]MBU7005426.1 hypothetical protein [Phosphitispora fastidiosa]